MCELFIGIVAIISCLVCLACLLNLSWQQRADMARSWNTESLDRQRERLLEALRRGCNDKDERLLKLLVRQNVQTALRYRSYADMHWSSIPSWIRTFYKGTKRWKLT